MWTQGSGSVISNYRTERSSSGLHSLQTKTHPISVKSKVLKRALNMSGCSPQSRALLVAMKNQLAASLEQIQLTSESQLNKGSGMNPYSTIVSCNNCEGFMVQPVCMPCGHSVCRGCTEKSTMLNGDNLICPKCDHSFPKIPNGFTSSSQQGRNEEQLRSGASPDGQCRIPTLTLQNVFQKWYPKWMESCRCREEGNRYANDGEFVAATHCYTKALETGT